MKLSAYLKSTDLNSPKLLGKVITNVPKHLSYVFTNETVKNKPVVVCA